MARAVSCFDCGEVTEIEEGDDETVCPECESYNVIGTTITPCPEGDAGCKDDNHHWGLGKHVVDDEE